MLEQVTRTEGGTGTATLPTSVARARSLTAAQRAVAMRPIPSEAICAGATAAAELAMRVDDETTGMRTQQGRTERAA